MGNGAIVFLFGLLLGLAAADAASSRPPAPKPPQPHIAAGFETYNIFWPYDSDVNGTVYACTYLPTLVMANNTRLIAHGNCALKPSNCNGLHLDMESAHLDSTSRVGTNPNVEGLICQKHSDDGGKTWSRLRLTHSLITPTHARAHARNHSFTH